MSLGHSTFGDTRRRRRRQFYWRLFRALFAMLAVGIIGGYGYQIGVSADQARSAKLEADLARFQQSNLDLRDQLALAAQSSGQANRALEELRRRYAQDVPQGELAGLMGRASTPAGSGS